MVYFRSELKAVLSNATYVFCGVFRGRRLFYVTMITESYQFLSTFKFNGFTGLHFIIKGIVPEMLVKKIELFSVEH